MGGPQVPSPRNAACHSSCPPTLSLFSLRRTSTIGQLHAPPNQPSLGPCPGHVGCLQLATHCCASPKSQSLDQVGPKRASIRKPDHKLTPLLPVHEGVPRLCYTAPQSHTPRALGSLGHRLGSNANLRCMAAHTERPVGDSAPAAQETSSLSSTAHSPASLGTPVRNCHNVENVVPKGRHCL